MPFKLSTMFSFYIIQKNITGLRKYSNIGEKYTHTYWYASHYYITVDESMFYIHFEQEEGLFCCKLNKGTFLFLYLFRFSTRQLT